MIAEVAVAVPWTDVFDYSVPENLKERVQVGSRVAVPLGSRERMGVVVAFKSRTGIPSKRLKAVREVCEDFPLFSKEALLLGRRMAAVFGCAWGEALEVMLPPPLRHTRRWTWPEGVRPFSTTSEMEPGRRFLGRVRDGRARRDYVREVMEQAFTAGKNVLILVPEHCWARQWGNDLSGDGREVIVWDSVSQAKEKIALWAAAARGERVCVVGTRSAALAPLRRIGAYVIFQEDNPAYEQEQPPHYHARSVLELRQNIAGGDLHYLSEVPSPEIWSQRARSSVFPTEIGKPSLSRLQVFDLNQYKFYGPGTIAPPVLNKIQTGLDQGRRCLIFFNRRGMGSLIQCQNCGTLVRCPRCEVSLSWHKSRQVYVCPSCSHAQPPVTQCPSCHKAYLKARGCGIERIKERLETWFPGVSIGLIDKETASEPPSGPIWVGTQAALKSLEKGDVHLAVVLDFDAEVNRPHFRSGARAFSLLMTLRQSVRDDVIVQTFDPGNVLLRWAQKDALNAFYHQELKSRKALRLPPYSVLIILCLRGRDAEVVEAEARRLESRLKDSLPSSSWVDSARPDFQSKLRGQYRWLVQIRAPRPQAVMRKIKTTIKGQRPSSRVKLSLRLDGWVEPLKKRTKKGTVNEMCLLGNG